MIVEAEDASLKQSILEVWSKIVPETLNKEDFTVVSITECGHESDNEVYAVMNEGMQ